jgi:hypothetical protein
MADNIPEINKDANTPLIKEKYKEPDEGLVANAIATQLKKTFGESAVTSFKGSLGSQAEVHFMDVPFTDNAESTLKVEDGGLSNILFTSEGIFLYQDPERRVGQSAKNGLKTGEDVDRWIKRIADAKKQPNSAQLLQSSGYLIVNPSYLNDSRVVEKMARGIFWGTSGDNEGKGKDMGLNSPRREEVKDQIRTVLSTVRTNLSTYWK